jgi:hypothetical protein
MIREQWQNSNFNGTPTAQGFFDPTATDSKAKVANFFDQRARLSYIAKANDSVRLVTQFELDYSFWGNSSYNTKRNQGGALGADTVNLETKHIYLEVKPSKSLTLRGGMQPFDDAFKGVLVSADMVGLQATAEYGKSNALFGFYRFDDKSSDILGDKERDMIALDYKYALTKETKIGGAYYFINDDRRVHEPAFLHQQSGTSNEIHTAGLNFETTMGPLTLDGFALYQFGTMHHPDFTVAGSRHISAFAGNVGARLKAGPGTARTQFLYVSGEKSKDSRTSNAFQSVNSTDADTEHGFYDSELFILGRDKYALTVDNAIVYSSNNADQGQIMGTVGYDMTFTPKLNGSANAGFAAVAKDNSAFGKIHKTNYLGTEVNLEVGYQAFESVRVGARAAYVFLGDYFENTAANGKTPDDLYAVRLLATYTF